jgi:hypothetical protein
LLYFVQFGCCHYYRDKKVVGVFVRFRARPASTTVETNYSS